MKFVEYVERMLPLSLFLMIMEFFIIGARPIAGKSQSIIDTIVLLVLFIILDSVIFYYMYKRVNEDIKDIDERSVEMFMRYSDIWSVK